MLRSGVIRHALLVALTLSLAPASPAHATPYGSALPRFALFGWVSPPPESTTVARYTELAGAGFNVTLLAWDDTGTWADNQVRLGITRPLGLKNLMLENDLDSIWVNVPSSWPLADSIVARYKDDPAFLGYYLGDEPPASAFARIGEWFDLLRERDPAHPAWNSLGPRGAFPTRAAFEAYVRQYVAATHPAVLCNNHYDFQLPTDVHQINENIASLGAIARENHIPFWGVLQLVEHWIFRHVTEGMLRWEVSQWLAGGATGIGYFTYWTPAPNAEYHWQPAMIEWGTGARTPYYDMVAALNARLMPLGNTLAGMTYVATQHAGSVPPGGVAFVPDSVLAAIGGRATLGRFVDSTGTPCAFVANSDSVAPRVLTLTVANGRRVAQLRDDGSAWDSLHVEADGTVALALEPGDFRLLRLPRPTSTAGVEPPAVRVGLSLRVLPNPARGAVQFAVSGTTGPARLELLDLAGRVLWTRAVAADAPLTWRGERLGEGLAPPGLYLAIVRDAHTRRVQRVTWLGSR